MGKIVSQSVLPILLAAVFTVGLTFATTELPYLTDHLLQQFVATPDLDTSIILQPGGRREALVRETDKTAPDGELFITATASISAIPIPENKHILPPPIRMTPSGSQASRMAFG